MDWLTNEILFYGGIAVALASLAAAFISFFVIQIRKIRLDAQLNVEYGEKDG